MKEIKVDYHTYMGIRTGVAGAFVVNENDNFFVNTEVLISCDEHPDTEWPMDTIVASINILRSDKDVSGLKKGHALVFASVVRAIPSDQVLQFIK